ncbi:sensor histidine kinase RegB [Rhodovulum sp. DZ06]|uniref:sensor histidine kinase RegB n=1 Tax=Rhodovulum sp. DZ06 TaxID=3425126 RepID=UPI003D33A6F3
MNTSSALLMGAARGDWVRLRTLVTLRWLAAWGQALTVLAAHYILRLDLPVGLCFGAIATSVCVNVVAHAVHPENKRLSENDTMLTLLFDLAQLGVLLFLTGGLTNPFAVLALAPVIISATALTLRSTLLLGVFAMVEFTLLAFFYVPLTFADGEVVSPPPLITMGTWAALLIGIVFLAGYARRVTAEIFSMSQALSATQDALNREQRLTAIGGLAAAAAHELGTPLATIKLVSKELTHDLADRPELREDLELIVSQAERCRDILRELSRGGKDDSHVKTAPVAALVEEAAEPHMDRGKRIVIRLAGRPAAEVGDQQPVVVRQPEVIHGMRNMVQNAVDFAATTVWVDVSWTDSALRIAVGDDGPGYRADILGRLGDPYVRRRDGKTAAPAQKPEGRKGYEGMGLGLFIAKTLLERTGARVSFANGSGPGRAVAAAPEAGEFARPTGAVVEAIWPRDALAPPSDLKRDNLRENERFSLSNI